MKIYKEGDHSKAICDTCDKMVATTFQVRDVPLSSGKAMVKGVLAAVCDECDAVVALPQQSASRVRETIESVKKPVEARVPQHLEDILRMSCELVAGAPFSSDLPLLLIRFYTDLLLSHSSARKQVVTWASSELAQGKASSRISLKVSGAFMDSFSKLIEQTHLSKTDLLKGIFVQMHHDLIEGASKPRLKKLKEITALLSA